MSTQAQASSQDPWRPQPGDWVKHNGRHLIVFAVADAGVYAGSDRLGPRSAVWIKNGMVKRAVG